MSSKAEKAAALAAVAASRRAGKRQTDGLESRLEEQKVFDEVDEAEYRAIVSKRRKQGQLVVGKDTLGYEDDGEDRFSDGSYDEEEEEGGGKKGGAGAGGGTAAAPAPAPAAPRVVHQVVARDTVPNLSADGGGASARLGGRAAAATGQTKKADMDELLNQLDDEGPESSVLGAASESYVGAGARVGAGFGVAAFTPSAAAGGLAGAPRRAEGKAVGALGGTGAGVNPFARGGARGPPPSAPAPGGEGGMDAEEGEEGVGGGEGEEGAGGAPEEGGEEAAGGGEDGAGGEGEGEGGAPAAAAAAPARARVAAPVVLKVAASKRSALAAAAAAAALASSPTLPAQKTLTGLSAAAVAAANARAMEEAASAPLTALGAGEGGAGAAAGGGGGGAAPYSLPAAKREHAFDRMRDRAGAPAPATLFYWLDAFEDPWKAPGVVHVFGKVMTNEGAVIGALRHNARVEALRARAAAAPPAPAPDAAAGAAAAGAPAGEDDESELLLGGGGGGGGGGGALPPPQPVPAPAYASACLTLTGFHRCMFVLPRERHARTGEPLSRVDVYNELKDRLSRGVLPKGSDARFMVKPVTRSYAFELAGVPREPAPYLKLLYSAAFPPLPSDATGDTFSRVFGAPTSSMEHLLLKRRLQGPCWLRLCGATLRNHPAPVSHCAVDLLLEDPKCVCVYGGLAVPKPPAPPLAPWAAALRGPAERAVVGEAALPLPTPELIVAAVSLKTQVAARTHAHEVVVASLVVHRRVSADSGSREERAATETLTLIRPAAGTSGLPADIRALVAKEPSMKMMHDEKALLTVLLAHVERIDPDVIAGHNIAGFDLDVLLHRMRFHKVAAWSKLGRLKRAAMPRTASGVGGREQFTGVLTAGRLICDTYLAAKELLMKETSYSLTSLGASQLAVTRAEVDPLDVPRLMTTGADCVKLARHTDNDAWLAMRLMFKLQVLPLTKQLTNLAGNLWSRSLKGARAERIEYLLLHEFHRLKYVVPDKERYADPRAEKALEDEEAAAAEEEEGEGGAPAGAKGGAKGGRRVTGTGTAARAAKGRQKPAYTGGLVLEPKKGLYDKFVLLLDFNSLYPSIIQEYNICFTTVDRALRASAGGGGGDGGGGSAAALGKKGKRKSAGDGGGGEEGGDAPPPAAEGGGEEEEEEEEEGGAAALALPPLPDKVRYPDMAVLPRVIRSLVMERRKVKNAAKGERDPGKLASLDIRQKALKILANSMYGCLGFSSSRFYAKALAALVTAQGREILQSTVDLATNKVGLEVIYGDTDSVMIHTASTDLKAVKEMGGRVMREVNALYKCLEIDIDGIFSMMLLLKKKKYAALKINEGPGGVLSETKEVKGLDLVRRDWCTLSKHLGQRVLDIILAPKKEREDVVENIHTLLAATGGDMRGGRVPLEGYVITKGLNKSPADYPDAKGQPHLQVALELIKRGKTVNVGDHIPYVICKEGAGAVDLGATGGSPGAGAAAAAAAPAAPSPQPPLPSPPPPPFPAQPTPDQGSPPAPFSGSPLPPPPAASASPEGATASGSPPQLQASSGSPPQLAEGGGVEGGAQKGGGGGKKASATAVAQRAWHPDDVRKHPNALHVDVEWYLTQQILPPISRMCEVIEGTSPARLAEVLGLDASRFAGQRSSRDYAREDDMGFVPRSLLPDEERFRGAEPLAVRCQRCGHTGVFPGALAPVPGGPPVPGAPAVRSGLFCTSPSGKCKGLWGAPPEGAEGGGGGGAPADAGAELAVCAARLHNALSLALRRSLCALQAGWLVCEDALCGTRTRCQSSRKAGYACTRPGCNSVLRPEREAGAAHNQLDYLRAVFDNEHARRSKEKAGVALPARPLYDKASGKVTIERAELPLGHYAVMDALCAQARDVLGHSAYHHVPLGGLFAYVGKMNERARVTVKPLSFPGAPAGGDEGAAAARAAAATAAAASGSTLGALGPAYSVAHGGGRGAPAKARRVGAAEGEGRPATDGFMALTEE